MLSVCLLSLQTQDITRVKKTTKRMIRKMMRNSFIIGMASIFCPTIIHVDSVTMDNPSDTQNISDDWKQVGAYMTNAYETARR